MPRMQDRKIERNSAVRYTDEVVWGNTVRSVEVAPQTREEEYRRYNIEKARERALSMNLSYVLFLTIAAVTVVAVCIYFLKLQATSTQLQKKTVSLQSELKEIKMENDIVYNEILSGVDLEKVRKAAIEDLGMNYPSEKQYMQYSAASSDYVKQYEEIPD